jgi:hypothetical protein
MTKHPNALERGGLISRSGEALRAACKLEVAPIEELTNWIDDLKASTEQTLEL